MRSARYISIAIVATLLYFSIAILLLNITLVSETLTSSNSLIYKMTLLGALIAGGWQSLTHVDFFLLCITAVLVGSNIAISVILISRLKQIGAITLASGGGTILGIISVGCASCGLSTLSLFGLSGLIALFPFGGVGIYIVAITLLSVSLFYNVKQLQKPMVCKK